MSFRGAQLSEGKWVGYRALGWGELRDGYDLHEVRYRGDWARTWPKKPLKIFFEKEKDFDGQHTLNLNSNWRDPAFIREQQPPKSTQLTQDSGTGESV